MEIYITDKKEIAELTEIVDPKTGIAWTADLLGNHNAGGWDDEREMRSMDSDEFDWWEELIAEYQEADSRKHELLEDLTGDEWDNASEAFAAIDCDLEDCPRLINAVCDEFEGA
jgi:hypothetical protein